MAEIASEYIMPTYSWAEGVGKAKTASDGQRKCYVSLRKRSYQIIRVIIQIGSNGSWIYIDSSVSVRNVGARRVITGYPYRKSRLCKFSSGKNRTSQLLSLPIDGSGNLGNHQVPKKSDERTFEVFQLSTKLTRMLCRTRTPCSRPLKSLLIILFNFISLNLRNFPDNSLTQPDGTINQLPFNFVSERLMAEGVSTQNHKFWAEILEGSLGRLDTG